MFGGDNQDNNAPADSQAANTDDQNALPAVNVGNSTDGDAAAPPQSQPSDMLSNSTASSDLLSLKQKALEQLSPLVSHLDQDPEEKFRTTMMMIQASDNSALLQDAYDAAVAIPDEKAKAQALLDVINEINYFTQNQEQ